VDGPRCKYSNHHQLVGQPHFLLNILLDAPFRSDKIPPMKPNQLRAGIAALTMLWLINSALAQSNIRTEKGGKLLLVVDEESVRNAPGAKPLLVIDGPNILTEKGGKRVFFIDGDILHTEPEGPVCAYIDGRHILTAPGGKELFYINGKEIKPNHDGPILYYVDGEDMNNQELMAVLYTLRPDLIQRPADAPSAAPAAPAEPAPAAAPAPAAPAAPAAPSASDAAAPDFAGGSYSIAAFHSSDATKHQGKITIKKQGDVYAMDLKFTDSDPWQGVAVQHNGELWAAIGPVNTVGLVVYNITGGNLAGTWMNVTGEKSSFGSENLTGPETIGGSYNITDAKAPFTGTAYAGTVAIDPLTVKTGGGDSPFYHLGWTMGTYKVEGVAFKSGNSLIGVSSTGPDCGIVRFKIDPATGNLTGDFCTVSKANGDYSLTKDGQ
jgi:hypothetical protein